MTLSSPALVILELAAQRERITRQEAAEAGGHGVKSADDYLRALACLGFLSTFAEGRSRLYEITEFGRALAERRPLPLG